MPSFEYEGVGADGRAVRGIQLGADIGAARATLKSRGVSLTSIRAAAIANDPLQSNGRLNEPVVPRERPRGGVGVVATPTAAPAASPTAPDYPAGLEPRPYVQSHIVGPVIGTVKLTEQSFFFQQFAAMLNAGVPIVQCLGTLSGQSTSAKMAAILKEAQSAVEQGYPVSSVFQRYPEVFSPIVMSLLRAGEEGGFLEGASRQIADYLDQDIDLRRMYSRLTFLPKLEVAIALIVIFGANAIIGSVRPGARGLTNPFENPLVYIPIFVLTVVTFLFLRIGLRHQGLRHGWDWFVRLVPGYGKVARGMAMARWGRAFGTLYSGGIDIPRAFQLAADASGNEEIRARMSGAPEKLRAGMGIGDALESTNAVSPIVMNMVRTGETTGNLDQMLQSMSRYYQEESIKKAKDLATITTMAIALFVMIVIGYIIITSYVGYAVDTVKMAEP